MSRKVIRNSRAAKPAAQFTLSLEDRRKFVAFFEILIAIDNRLKKAKKSKKKDADMPYGLDDSILKLVFLLCCFILLALTKQHDLDGDFYDRFNCFDSQQRYVSDQQARAVYTISRLGFKTLSKSKYHFQTKSQQAGATQRHL